MSDIMANLSQPASPAVGLDTAESAPAGLNPGVEGEFSEFSQALNEQVAEASTVEEGVVNPEDLQLEELVLKAMDNSDTEDTPPADLMSDPQIDQLLPQTGKDLPPGLPVAQQAAASANTLIAAATDADANAKSTLTRSFGLDKAQQSLAPKQTEARWYSLVNSGRADQSADQTPSDRVELKGIDLAINREMVKGANSEASMTRSLLNVSSQSPADSGPSASTQIGQLQTAMSLAAQAQSGAAQADKAIELPVGKPGWGQELGTRVVWMANQKVQTAQLQLSPRDLGPVDVRISIQNEQATVTFNSHSAQVREAIETALPRLREMMGESGLQLAHTDVSDHRSTEQERDGQTAARSEAGAELANDDETTAHTLKGTVTLNRLVDYYA